MTIIELYLNEFENFFINNRNILLLVLIFL